MGDGYVPPRIVVGFVLDNSFLFLLTLTFL